MTKTAILALLVALLGVSVHASRYNPTCSVASAACGASASLNIKVDGPGSCYVRSDSYCNAFAKSTGDCVNYKQIRVGGQCREVDIQEDVKCWAGAIATAYTDALSQVSCTGGFTHACSTTVAKASSIACATARSILYAEVNLGPHKAECRANIDVAISAIAAAVARSGTKVCVDGYGYRKLRDFDFAGAVQVALARAFATCWLYCDDYTSHVIVDGGGEGIIVKDETRTIGDDSDATTSGEPLEDILGPDGVDVGTGPVEPSTGGGVIGVGGGGVGGGFGPVTVGPGPSKKHKKGNGFAFHKRYAGGHGL